MARLDDFDQHLKANNIPFSGLSDSGGVRPESITINFLPEATAEQIAWAQNAKEIYDWRERRLLSRSQIVTAWQGLTDQQRNAVMRHLLAIIIRQNRSEVIQSLATVGVDLPIDEVDPDPQLP